MPLCSRCPGIDSLSLISLTLLLVFSKLLHTYNGKLERADLVLQGPVTLFSELYEVVEHQHSQMLSLDKASHLLICGKDDLGLCRDTWIKSSKS